MESSIGHLRLRYRQIGPEPIGAERLRLNDVICEDVPEELESCLRQALTGTDGVCIIREVNCGIALSAGMERRRAARMVAERMAGAIVRALANGEAEMVRFPSESEYLARFIADELRGEARGKWYYGPFRRLEALPAAEAIGTVLRENRAHVPAILARLHAARSVDLLLAQTGAAAIRSLCADPTDAPPSPDSLRPLFHIAVRLFEALGGEIRGGARLQATLDRWIALGGVLPDWRDRAELTRCTASLVEFLSAETGLRPGVADRDALESALRDADWLDVALLRTSTRIIEDGGAVVPVAVQTPAAVELSPSPAPGDVLSLSRPNEGGFTWSEPRSEMHAGPPASVTPAAKRPIATPLERELLGDLRAALNQASISLRFGDAAGNAVRVFAALVHARSKWGETPERRGMALAVIDRLAAPRAPSQDVSAEERELAERIRGERAPGVVVPDSIDTECAGIFLLVRALLDARVGFLGASLGYPAGDRPVPALLASIALAWAGAFDPAIFLMGGEDAPATAEDLRAAWRDTGPEAHSRFQAGLLRMLLGHRLLSGEEMRVSVLPTPGGPVQVAGCEAPGLWPFAGPEREHTVAQWVNGWTEAAGSPPSVVLEEDCGMLAPSWQALAPMEIGGAGAVASLFAIANSLLRLWARWLRQFAGSSAPYLLRHFIRRPGRIVAEHRRLTVYLEPRPLDLILEMAGYQREIEAVPGILDRSIRFRWGA
jgi:hypothetical protein